MGPSPCRCSHISYCLRTKVELWNFCLLFNPMVFGHRHVCAHTNPSPLYSHSVVWKLNDTTVQQESLPPVSHTHPSPPLAPLEISRSRKGTGCGLFLGKQNDCLSWSRPVTLLFCSSVHDHLHIKSVPIDVQYSFQSLRLESAMFYSKFDTGWQTWFCSQPCWAPEE